MAIPIILRRWLLRRLFPDLGDQMVTVRGSYLYVDFYRQLWRLRPTGDPASPLIITLEER